jgi:FtsZ-binding cell division protein ZapB
MPTGSFVILLPLDADYSVLGYYHKSKSDFEITNDLFLRLNLDHSKDEYNLLKLKENQIFSYIYKFKGKLARKASGIIIGLLLNESDKPEKFRSALKEGAEAIEVLGLTLLKMNSEEFEPLLKDIYLEHLEPLIDTLKPDALKDSVITITKFMLSGGKQERKIAQDLLKKIEDGEHEKIKAAEIAQDLYVIDIAESLKEKANFSEDVPDVSKAREKLVQEARNFLRNENFHSAYISYKKASELSKKLVKSKRTF